MAYSLRWHAALAPLIVLGAIWGFWVAPVLLSYAILVVSLTYGAIVLIYVGRQIIQGAKASQICKELGPAISALGPNFLSDLDGRAVGPTNKWQDAAQFLAEQTQQSRTDVEEMAKRLLSDVSIGENAQLLGGYHDIHAARIGEMVLWHVSACSQLFLFRWDGVRWGPTDPQSHDRQLPIGIGATVPQRVSETQVLVKAGDGTSAILVDFPEEKEPVLSNDLNSLPVPMIRLSRGGNIVWSNRQAQVFFDHRALLGCRLSDVLEGLGRSLTDWLSEVIEGRATHTSEFLRILDADRDRFVQVSLSRDPADPNCLFAVLNDATELKSLEAQFVQSQKMQAIGQLAGGVAHDFNNLLTAISGHCDLLLHGRDSSDPDYADLMQITQNANRAAGLVGQLLAFSRKQTLRPEVLDMRDTMADLTHLLNRLVGEKIRLNFRHDPVLAPVRVDPRQLEQVIMNLVVNARDAMPQGGNIHVNTENLILKSPMIRDQVKIPKGQYVLVRVTDQGCGIPKDKLQKVFEPFFTTKRVGEGTGLGLSTVYGIVKQTGGYVFVESEVGQGTSFFILFPAHAHEAGTSIEADHRPSTIQRHAEGVILIVEDEAAVRAFAARALRLSGYSVIEASSGEEALEVLNDLDTKVDLFVTDVVMPGMDGPTWVKKARENYADTDVVFVSGYAEESFDGNQRDIPNSHFLPKPFSLSELTGTVQRALAS